LLLELQGEMVGMKVSDKELSDPSRWSEFCLKLVPNYCLEPIESKLFFDYANGFCH
jgi:hypothetical protein